MLGALAALVVGVWGVVHAEQAELVRVGFLKPGGGYTVETIPLETYVARVLAGEAARGSRPAALEALAITIRTFALSNRSRHRADGFDLCDQTHCQVVRQATAATARAAASTAGRVLLRGGVPAAVYYTASCGGRTEIPSAVWPGADDPSYLPSQPDDACGGTPHWTADLTAADLTRALRRGGYRGDRLDDLRVASRTTSGRAGTLNLTGMRPDAITGQDLRVLVGRALGWQHILSTAFDVRRSGGVFTFTGVGSGHGVGLCVIGSARLASAGETADAILARYYPGLRIGSVTGATLTEPAAIAARRPPYGGDIMLSLPEGDEGERASIIDLVSRSRDELARTLGVQAPRELRIRFHESIDGYSRTTSQPWFMPGAVTGGGIELAPLAILRERGALERTLRGELVRLMTDRELNSRPLWVSVGLALHLADVGDDRSSSPQDRSAPAPEVHPFPGIRIVPSLECPSDAELSRPVSAGALASAYARARACVERQLAGGKPWRDVR